MNIEEKEKKLEYNSPTMTVIDAVYQGFLCGSDQEQYPIVEDGNN